MSFLKGTIDRIEKDIAVIILENNQQLNYPLAKITPSLKAGDQIELTITLDEKNTLKIEGEAKQILNDILQPN